MTASKVKKIRSAILLLPCAWFWPFLFISGVLCRAEGEIVRLEIYAGAFDSIPIGVSSFSSTTDQILHHEDKPWQIIADDLEFSGRFNVVRTAGRDTALLASVATRLLIEGEYTIGPDSLEFMVVLTDPFLDAQAMSRKYRVSTKETRSAAHRFSNELYEAVFNERGIFESRIIFIRDRGEEKNVFLMDYDGKNVAQTTFSQTINMFPCFIGEQSFGWVSYKNGRPDIFKSELFSKQHEPFISSRYTDTSPHYSPIEDKMVFASSRGGSLDVYVCDLDGGNIRRLTFGRSIDTSPCWSPDGYHIAFVSDRTGRPLVYIMDVEGTNVRRLTRTGTYQDSPAWSPGGDLIAFTSLEKGRFDIWASAPDGSNFRRLTDMPGKNEYPSWSPNGSHVIFQSTQYGRRELYTVRANGSGVRRLTNMGNAVMPEWSSF